MSNKRLNLLPVWAAVSAVIILAGIVLMALLGFNVALDRPESKVFDVHYNVVVDLNEESKASLERYCEQAFADAGIAYSDVATLDGQSDPVSLDQGSFSQTGNDFLELLRRADVRLPSLLGSILGSSHGGSMLLAGRAQRSMPVLYVLGDRLAAMPHGLQGLQPFGLSDKPLSIEGNISLPPRRNPAARSYRLHIDPRYLDPRH